MKRLGFALVAALLALRASGLNAQAPTSAPMPVQPVVPQTMPMDAAAMPMNGGQAPLQYGDAMNSYGGSYAGDYCGDGCSPYGNCGPGGCGPGGPFNGCGPAGAGGSVLTSRMGRGYIQLDAVMFHRSDAAARPLLTDAAFTPLIAGNDPYFGFETLPRLIAGYVLPNDTAIEATYFYKDDFDAWFSNMSGAPNLQIGSPAFFVPGFAQGSLNLSNEIQNLEINLVETSRKINFIAGFRWLEIEDKLRFNASGPGVLYAQSIDTYNSMFGGQMGVRTNLSKGLWTLETQGKAGYFYNTGSSQSSILVTGVVPLNPPQADGECDSFVGELGGTLTFRPTAAVAFRLGYQVMWICNTALAVDQIDQNNALLFTGTYLNDRGDITLHGPSAGIDVRW